eukprot:3265928-Pyramimonas_sp.AAC.4
MIENGRYVRSALSSSLTAIAAPCTFTHPACFGSSRACPRPAAPAPSPCSPLLPLPAGQGRLRGRLPSAIYEIKSSAIHHDAQPLIIR